ncbi:AAA family ATPase [Bordetella pertussis]|uniref:AAA family ATPase n=1 Tax=Bordetella pertussis TaxID=520 RepID=UPI0003D3FBE0|nr:AAA family ATPase [Bordetella pertussis]AMS95943.1 chromosome segregation protein SMC [Bordetella pertussis]ANA18083.1 chromosome segregation protein SMC [Bordetella pertussis]AQB31394.1 chromosome segregation protein SMC [Bordetella pertussis]AQB83970.1 chromosome segregation protein SMC [Bordetella pertussis]AZX51676.1 chromosome segregation protein SMC [Bordetella pertussis]
MTQHPFISRVAVRNYKSIGYCDVNLRPLTYLVGHNGAGKSNFMDALHFVCDALSYSLDSALNERGGINEVRRRSGGHPTHFALRVEFVMQSGQAGRYGFVIGALKNGGYEVQREECVVAGIGKGPFFRIEKGKLRDSSETTFPSVTADRLALVAASGLTAFRPVFDALTAMGFYNFNPKLMRELQKPQDGRLLRPAGENIASVIGHLEKVAPAQMALIQEYLHSVAPMVHGVERKPIGPMETLEFRQDMAGSKHPWRFLAQNMSDGTLRALGVLSALLQGNVDYSPTLIGIEEPETALHPAASAALREALVRASETTQVLVTSHSPDLLDDHSIDADAVLAVVSEAGETKVAPLDEGSRQVMRDHLFSAGELLRMNQLAPDRASLEQQDKAASGDLFGETESV